MIIKNHCSAHHLSLLRVLAQDINKQFYNRFDEDELVSVGWLGARFIPEKMLRGKAHWIKDRMYKWIRQELRGTKNYSSEKFQIESKHNLVGDMVAQVKEILSQEFSTTNIDIFLLYFLDNESPREIAKKLRCSHTTIYTRLRAMKSKLKH